MKRKILLQLTIFVISIVLLTVVFGCDTKEEATEVAVDDGFITFVASPPGGAYYPIGGAFATLIDKIDGVTAHVQVSGGAVQNAALVGGGDNDLGITYGGLAYAAMEGRTPYDKAYPEIATLISRINLGAIQIVVPKDSDIKSIADFKGRSIAVGPSGGGGLVYLSDMFEVAGISFDDINASYIDYSDSMTALRDGSVDAAAVAAAIPTPAIEELLLADDNFTLLSLTDDFIGEVRAQFPYYSEYIIAGELYQLDEAVSTLGQANMIVINKNLSEDLVYEITKTVFENLDVIHASHPAAGGVSLEFAVEGIPIPLHPGAEKYYKEVGVY